jgi:hypothetical protein
MSDDDKDDGPAIYRVDTIPPPDGEDDAYSAPTKVGPMADAAVRELMQAAEKRAQELSARIAGKKIANAEAAKAAASMPTPLTVKPTGVPIAKPPTPPAAAPPAAAPPASARLPSATPANGPVSGRVVAHGPGPVGRTVSTSPPAAAKPPSAPRPAAIPRVDASEEPALPPLVPLGPPPVNLSLDGDPAFPPPPRHDTADAQALMQRSAPPPPPPRQEHTALLPVPSSARPADAAAPLDAALRAREPIPFDRSPVAPQEPAPRVLVMPLVVGFLIFAIGLAFYIWAR